MEIDLFRFLQVAFCCYKWLLQLYPKFLPIIFMQQERLLKIRTIYIMQGILKRRKSLKYSHHVRCFLLVILTFISYIEKEDSQNLLSGWRIIG